MRFKKLRKMRALMAITVSKSYYCIVLYCIAANGVFSKVFVEIHIQVIRKANERTEHLSVYFVHNRSPWKIQMRFSIIDHDN